MWRRTVTTAMAIVGACCVAGTCDAALPDTSTPGLMETLIRGAEHREALYSSLGATCTSEMFYSDRQVQIDCDSSGRQDLGTRALDVVRFRWSGTRWWLEVLELCSSGWNNWCFLGALPAGPNQDGEGKSPPRAVEFCDGEQLWRLDFRQPTAVVRDAPGSGRLQGSLRSLAHALLLHVNNEPLSEFLRSLKAPVIEGIETVQGVDCYRVVDYRPAESGAGGYMAAIWIAPDKGFAPVKFEDLFIPGKEINGQRYVTLCSRMQEVRPGLWLPRTASHQVYTYLADDPHAWRWTRVVGVQSWEVDVPVEPACFETMLPLGTTVVAIGPSPPATYVVGDTHEVARTFDASAPPPPIDAARARPLVSSDLRENAWP